jgi:energy-coupling factor transporter ATP-binding protein EcfA2
MLNIKIKNFQSIGDISFDVEGFTVIVGKNNLGKSAIIRAIDAALTNRTGSEFIRWGKTKAEVSLKNEGLDINWSKGDTAVYKINGVAYSKLNRTIPQPIQDVGIKRIEMGNEKLNPLIAHQFEELFLLNKPGSVITDVLSLIYNLHILSDADDLCVKEMKTKKSVLKIRESDQTSLKEQLDKYKDLDLIKAELKIIKKMDQKTAELSAEITELNSFIKEIKTFIEKIENLKRASEIVIPSPIQAEKMLLEYTWFNQIINSLRGSLGLVRALETASKSILPEYTNTQDLVEQLREIREYSEFLETTQKTVNELEKFFVELNKVETLTASLPSVEEKIKDTLQSYILIDNFMLSARKVKDLKTETETNEKNLSKVQKEFAQYKTCPLCQKPL